jgi:cytoskeletal protein RodZ
VARKKKRSRFKLFPLSLVLVVVVWVTSFLVWFFWKDIQRTEILSGKNTTTAQPQQPSQEKISEEERKKLDEILKRRR